MNSIGLSKLRCVSGGGGEEGESTALSKLSTGEGEALIRFKHQFPGRFMYLL